MQDSLAAPPAQEESSPLHGGTHSPPGSTETASRGHLPVLPAEPMEVGQSFCSAEPFGRSVLRCRRRSQLVICAARQPRRSEVNEFNTSN